MRRTLAIFVLLLAVALSAGCVERRLTITCGVAGAQAYLDGEHLGPTPVEVKFIHYGMRDYTVRADGYEPASGQLELGTPWYEYPPADLFAEVLVPFTIHDEHALDVKLEPLKPRDSNALYGRAAQYREASRQVTPLAPEPVPPEKLDSKDKPADK